MGFKTGAYAKVWSIEDMGSFHKANIQTSRKDKVSGEYVTDFSDYVRLVGHAHESAKELNAGDRIKIGDCEATTKYNEQTSTKYHNYTIFSFEGVEAYNPGSSPAPTQSRPTRPVAPAVNDDPF